MEDRVLSAHLSSRNCVQAAPGTGPLLCATWLRGGEWVAVTVLRAGIGGNSPTKPSLEVASLL